MSEPPSAAGFPTTCWGRILQAGDPAAPEARASSRTLPRLLVSPLCLRPPKGQIPSRRRTWFKDSLPTC